jgi:hypothetical protein
MYRPLRLKTLATSKAQPVQSRHRVPTIICSNYHYGYLPTLRHSVLACILQTALPHIKSNLSSDVQVLVSMLMSTPMLDRLQDAYPR